MNDRLEAFRERLRGPARAVDPRSSSPLVIAIFTVALAAFGNILLAYVNNSAQRDLERVKEEGSLILEMIKTTPAKARINLQFIVEAGLLSDKQQIAKLQAYFNTHKPESGPSLPPPEASSGAATKKPIVRCADVPAVAKRIFVKHLRVPTTKVTDNASITGDLKADELDVVELTMAVEAQFGVEIPDDVAPKLNTVSDYIKFVQNAHACK